MTDFTGAVQAEYDYDPYGRQVVLSQAVTADFGYTGMYQEHAANLDLTLFRAYDPEKGRWLSRDPLEDQNPLLRTGPNLYDYAVNDPLEFVDPYGLFSTYGWGFIAGGVVFALGFAGQPELFILGGGILLVDAYLMYHEGAPPAQNAAACESNSNTNGSIPPSNSQTPDYVPPDVMPPPVLSGTPVVPPNPTSSP